MDNELNHVRLQVDDDQRRIIDSAVRDAKLAIGTAFLFGLGIGWGGFAYALEPVVNAERAAVCHEEAQGVRLLADSRDQGGSIGAWLNVADSTAWRELVASVWDSGRSPLELYAVTYAGCMAGHGGVWEQQL